MACGRIGMFEEREVLLQWAKGTGYRTIHDGMGVDWKTARRWVEAGRPFGLVRGGEVTAEIVALTMPAIRPTGATADGRA
jgi:hypothetical protein